jgi:5'-methylthioadenosine phosphorylase
MRVGILGGSGVYDLGGLKAVERKQVKTSFGDPSDAYVCGTLEGVDVCFLARHGAGHHITPTEINHRANIMGFKMLGVDRVLSICAVGSLREEFRPRDIVLPDQYFDRSKQSTAHTFFGGGLVAHVAFGEPTCEGLRRAVVPVIEQALAEEPPESRPRLHVGGTYVHMEGPAFSTRAESNVYRSFGFHVIGMTSLAEAKLCREAEICYQAMAMVTDYDCWRDHEEAVSIDQILGHLRANNSLAQRILTRLVPRVAGSRECRCAYALEHALVTDRSAIPPAALEALRPIVGKYLR